MIFIFLGSLLRSQAELAAENLLLRQQFAALAAMNLVFDAKPYNLEAYIVDYGPNGAKPEELQGVEAWPWQPPIDDPVRCLYSAEQGLTVLALENRVRA